MGKETDSIGLRIGILNVREMYDVQAIELQGDMGLFFGRVN